MCENPYLNSRKKRIIDLGIAGSLLPIETFTVGALAVSRKSNALSRHARVDTNGKELIIPKVNLPTNKLGSYATQLGLDELPQITNVIQGSMSFFGPRALTRDEHNTFIYSLPAGLQFAYLQTLKNAKPGIFSSYAIASHRGNTAKKRALMNMYDAHNASPVFDFRMIAKFSANQFTELILEAPCLSQNDPVSDSTQIESQES